MSLDQLGQLRDNAMDVADDNEVGEPGDYQGLGWIRAQRFALCPIAEGPFDDRRDARGRQWEGASWILRGSWDPAIDLKRREEKRPPARLGTMQWTRVTQEQRISGRHRKIGRTVVGVAAVLAILGAQLIGGAGGPAAAAGAGRVKPQSGLYKGKTAEGTSVSFEVKRGRIRRPGFIVFHRGCLVKINFTEARRVNGRGGFFFGRRSSGFLGGKFTTRRKVRGKAGVDLSHSSCPGRGVHEVRFRARRVRPVR